MKILTPEIKQTLDFITPEETILLTGKKDSGKATAIEALAQQPIPIQLHPALARLSLHRPKQPHTLTTLNFFSNADRKRD